MSIFYCPSAKSWCSDHNLTFGSSRKKVLQVTELQNKIPFTLSLNGDNTGPLIGILTGEGKHGNVAGNGPLFKALQIELLHLGGISVVFTAKQLHSDGVDGYLYLPEQDKWVAVSSPFPHLIYNRIPFRSHEKMQSFHHALSSFNDRNIPIFNPGFIVKKDLFALMKKSQNLAPFLPETLTNPNAAELAALLYSHKRVYLKPSSGAKGKGIFVVEYQEDGAVTVVTHEKNKSFSSFHTFWEEMRTILNKKDYVAQEAITPALIRGSRFDFRILVHHTENGYDVTGIGLRASKPLQITTHVPNGGKILPYSLVQTEQHDEFIIRIAAKLGQLLSDEYGFFGEFSIDAGISAQGNYYIYEVNSKPMSFNEEEIERERIKRLCALFFQQTGFIPLKRI